MISRAGFHKLTAALFLTGAVIGLFFQFYYHKFLNNDALSYMNIGELYAQGEWSFAINGYWSPLYCWLLALCDLAGIPLLGACYVINFIGAGFSLYLGMKIASRYISVDVFYYLFSFFALAFLLFYAMSVLTPDLIGCAFCVWFLWLITHESFAGSKRMPYIAGIAGACMYFAKSYNFAVLNLFLCCYILFLLWKKNRLLIKPLLRTYAVFLLVSFIWITILSIHENKLTFATSGRYNYNLVAPGYSGANPIDLTLIAPPFQKAYFAHINPAHFLDTLDWSPFSSSRNFRHQLHIIADTIWDYYKLLDGHYLRTLLLLGALLLILLNRKKLPLPKHAALIPLLLFFLIYPVLYFPLFVLDRYVYVCTLLFNFFFFYLISLTSPLLPWKLFTKKPVLMGAAVMVVIMAVPVTMMAKKKLASSATDYKYYKAFHQQLPKMAFLQNQRIVSDGSASLESAQLCYYYQCSYYCKWSDGQYHSLQQYQIRYLLTTKEQVPFPFLVLKEKIPVDNTTLYIYEIK